MGKSYHKQTGKTIVQAFKNLGNDAWKGKGSTSKGGPLECGVPEFAEREVHQNTGRMPEELSTNVYK